MVYEEEEWGGDEYPFDEEWEEFEKALDELCEGLYEE